MADYVKITKDGLRAYTWNYELKKAAKKRGESIEDESRFYDIEEPEDSNIWSFLRCSCTIDDGVTVLDIFKMVEKYPLLVEFLRQYSWCRHIDKFHAQAILPLAEDDGYFEHLDYAEVYQGGDVRDNELSVFPGFHAIGDPKSDDPATYEPGEKIQYSISYSPASHYANLVVKLNDNLVLYNWDNKTDYKPTEAFKGTRELTLLEILDAIYWDISFMGGPEDNESFLKDMKNTVEEIKHDNVDLKKYKTVEEMWADLDNDE